MSIDSISRGVDNLTLLVSPRALPPEDPCMPYRGKMTRYTQSILAALPKIPLEYQMVINDYLAPLVLKQIIFTPMPQQAGGAYQVGVFDSAGALHVHKDRIDIQRPGEPCTIEINKPVTELGVQVMISMEDRTDELPVNMTTLIQSVRAVFETGIVLLHERFEGNHVNVQRGDRAYLRISVPE